MPYCTIEDAWQETLNPELLEQDKDHQLSKSESNIFCNSCELYDINNTPPKKPTRVKKHSRTYKRLPKHNGNTKRLNQDREFLISSEKIEEVPKSKIRSKPLPKILHGSKKAFPANISAHNDYDINLPNEDNLEANIEYTNKSKDLKSNASLMEDFQDDINDSLSYNLNNDNVSILNNEYNDEDSDDESIDSSKYNQDTNVIDNLKLENKRLKKIIEELRHSPVKNKDSFMDLIIYIATGVLIILMMENINSLIRRF